MTALRHGTPDRVPATPDISIMIPCRLTGRPFWEIEVNENPSLTFAYINAVKFFGIDGWMFNGTLDFKLKSEVVEEKKVIHRDGGKWVVHYVYHTPDGDLTQTAVFPRDNPSTVTEKMIKDFRQDFKKIRHLFSGVISYDKTTYLAQKKEMGEHGMICVWIGPPGFQTFVGLFHGNLEALTYAYYDCPDLFEELAELYEKHELQRLDMALDAGVESILTGGSGSITLQSPPCSASCRCRLSSRSPSAAGRRASCAGSIPAARSGPWSKPAPTRPTWITSTRWRSHLWATVTWRRSSRSLGISWP